MSDTANKIGRASDSSALLCQFNLERVLCISAIYMLLQIISAVANRAYLGAILLAGIVLVSLVCVVYSIVVFVYKERLLRNLILARRIYLSYWACLLFALIPHFVYDLRAAAGTEGIFPVNLIMFCISLIFIPTFEFRESLAAFMAFIAVNAVLAFFCNAPLAYLGYALGLAAAGILLTYFIQQPNISIILRLNHENRVDPLTGVLNRRGGMEKAHTVLEVTKRYGGMLAVYMLDVDNFKGYNDSFGHVVGDAALKMVSEAISNVFARDSDVVCRYGGEEFVIIASLGEVEAYTMAEKLLRAIRSLDIPASPNSCFPMLTVSVGGVIYKPGIGKMNITEMDLIKIADSAMYASKSSGKNRLTMFEYDLVV